MTAAALTLILTLSAGAFEETVATAKTPEAAVFSASGRLGRGELRLPAGAFQVLPPPAAGLSYVARARPGEGRRSVLVEVEAQAHGRLLDRRAFAFTTAGPRVAVVPTRTVRSGEIVTADMVRLVEEELPKDGEGYASELSEVVGQMAKGALLVGRPVALRQVKAPEIVKRGQRLAVRALRGPLTVSLTAEAMEPGGAGEVIRAINPASKRVIFIRILEAGHGEVSE